MHKGTRSFLMASVALGIVAAAVPAKADPAEQSEIAALRAQLQAMQSQMLAQQKQLDAMMQMQQAKTVPASAPVMATAPTYTAPMPAPVYPSGAAATASVAPQPVASAPAPATTTASSGGFQDAITRTQANVAKATGVKLTPGGYIETDAIYRSKNESADNFSSFNTLIPFNNSANAHQSEFRMSARSTRLSLLGEAQPSNSTKLVAYVESDFLGAASTANSVESNSYTPRLRQAYAGYENSDLGLNVYAGQTWSLATLYKSGLSPRSEALPLTIDLAELPGFTYTRNPGVRVVKEFDDNKVSVAFAAESPQVNFGGITTPTTVTATNTGSTSTQANVTSTDVAPDLILKTAFDPGYGHYEAYGIGRFFHDNVNATLHNNVVFAGGGGLGAVLPVVPKMVDIQANVMAGEGIGRYGPAQLPDFAFGTNGSIKPLTEYMATLGAVVRPTDTWTGYVYAGMEDIMRDSINGVTTTSSGFGYGNYGVSNAGCYVNNGSCTAQTSLVWQVTGGVWKDLYKGDYGNMKIGVQDSLTRRNAFSDTAGNAPHAYENIVLTAFRYSPFK